MPANAAWVIKVLLIGYFDFARDHLPSQIALMACPRIAAPGKNDSITAHHGDGLVQVLHLIPQISMEIVSYRGGNFNHKHAWKAGQNEMFCGMTKICRYFYTEILKNSY